VRTPGEWNEGHHKDAILFPLQEINEKLNTLDKNKKYLVYCRRGARAYNFQLRMKNAGFKNVVNILGAWSHIDIFNKYKFKK
jgi:rhodanese-related sulfurtransferase